ncbi:MAG: hypothetical protein AAGU19_05085 [Prolixibacteraceae bacterium]
MKTLKLIYKASVGTMLLTLIHHVYGAVIYEATFRLHVAYVAIPVILLLIFTYRSSVNHSYTGKGKLALRFFLLTTILISVGAIGIFEGGYNHVLKNILFFCGTSRATFDLLYPPIYELPDDFIFEATGILQFITGCIALYYLLKLRKEFPVTVYCKKPEKTG